MKRNRSEIGRYAAGIIAVILLTIVPLRYLGAAEKGSAESHIQSALDGFVSECQDSGRITEDDYSRLRREISASGAVFDFEMSVGTSYYGMDDAGNTVTTRTFIYTGDIVDELADSGVYELNDGDTLTVKLTARTQTTPARCANLLFKTDVSTNVYTSGCRIGR